LRELRAAHLEQRPDGGAVPFVETVCDDARDGHVHRHHFQLEAREPSGEGRSLERPVPSGPLDRRYPLDLFQVALQRRRFRGVEGALVEQQELRVRPALVLLADEDAEGFDFDDDLAGLGTMPRCTCAVASGQRRPRSAASNALAS
jgi:hypothetical protein